MALHSSTVCATRRACVDEEGKLDGIELQQYTQVTAPTTVQNDGLPSFVLRARHGCKPMV
jgi:hypothetical protein